MEISTPISTLNTALSSTRAFYLAYGYLLVHLPLYRFIFWWLEHRLSLIFLIFTRTGLQQKQSGFAFIIFLWLYAFYGL
jgi:hypothetical protein